jgi:2-polyprenyl-3-methyl-5-hydroxy-6-metoxy-1,4-benzoquinol methylase
MTIKSSLDPGNFPACAACGAYDWTVVYKGPVRDGSFGRERDAVIARCGDCGVDRLDESLCLNLRDYELPTYRDKLKQSHEAEKHQREHDELARFTLETIWPMSLRGSTVADFGCGGGVLLDHLRGVAGALIAIEPNSLFGTSLMERGYDWYRSGAAATEAYPEGVDLLFSTQVIEHVDEPYGFMKEAYALLKPGGRAIISTPNREDILMEMLPNEFPRFFYRTQHRWSFHAASLKACAERAGLVVLETRHVHRYGIANAMHWLKDKQPRGRAAFSPFDDQIDKLWRNWLEATGRSDNLYLIAERPK